MAQKVIPQATRILLNEAFERLLRTAGINENALGFGIADQIDSPSALSNLSVITGTAAATGGVALTVDNANAQTSGKILSLKTGGSEVASLDYTGKMTVNGGVQFSDGSTQIIAAGAGWHTALDLDFTAQTPQTFSADGNYTIAGKTWVKFNTANEASAAAIDATGLVITPSSTSDYNGATRTFPGIYIDLANVIPNYDPSMSVRVSAYVSSFNGAANYDNAVLVMDTASTAWGFGLKRGTGTTGVGFQSFFSNNATNVSGFISDLVAMSSSNNVMILEVPSSVYPLYHTFDGAYSSGWPASTAFNHHHSWASAVGSVDATHFTGSLKVALGAQRSGSATSLVVKFGRIKIEYK